MQIGYARVSTDEQSTRLQLDALVSADCERVFSEQASGAASGRPILAEAISHLRRSDTLIEWRLDRLGRSLPHLMEVMQRLEEDGGELRSLTEGVDTTKPNGRLTLNLLGALAQFKRDLIRERTQAGLATARDRGCKGGRPPKLSPEKVRVAERLLKDPESIMSEVVRTLGVHRSTLYKALQQSAPGEDPRSVSLLSDLLA